MSTQPVPPPHLDSQVDHWVNQLADVINDGDLNAHIVLSSIVGQVYADGHRAGFSACLMARPLDKEKP